MRILLVHNFYGSSAPSGENKVFEAEKAMLERHGETVATYTRHSDEIRFVVGGWWLVVGVKKIINLIKGALCTIGNPFAARALTKKIREFKPDVVHFHNTFPLISPLALRAAHKCGCKVVMTLHNYRTVCAAGVPMRDGKVCAACFLRGCDQRGGRCRGGAEIKVETQRRRAEAKVSEWLAGVDASAFETALVKLVEEKSVAGEYRFKKPEEKALAVAGARRFFREFSRKIIVLSDGRCVYFAPDPRARGRNVDNAVSWAEYAFHAVSSSGRLLQGSTTLRERLYNHNKVENLPEIEGIVREEKGVCRLIDVHPENDAVIFVGFGQGGGRMEVVTRLDEFGNAEANLGEVTVVVRHKARKENPPPKTRPLTEVVEAVAKHQAAGFSPSTTGDSLANFDGRRKRAHFNLSIRPALRNRCYRHSFLATLPLAINIWLYRHCWATWVDRFICLTPFAKDMMASAGFPIEKLVVKGNYIQCQSQPLTLTSNRNGVLFVGRLSPEKGPQILIEAWNLMGKEAPDLTIIGDGDFRSEYEAMAKSSRIHFVGQKSREDVLAAVAAAKLVVIPSMCYEGLPTNLMEAFMLGTPCLASDLGALPGLVGQCGLVFKPGDPQDLSSKIKTLFEGSALELMGRAAREVYERTYTEPRNYECLMVIYRYVLLQ